MITDSLANTYLQNKPYLVVNAISGNSHAIINKPNKFIYLYAGGLHLKYNSLVLVKAFSSLCYKDIELHLYGNGDAVESIIEFAKNDKRIIYGGVIPNSEVLMHLREASILVNPRPTTLWDTSFTFPSKLIEYLESGTTTVTTRLAGIPSEYLEHFLFFEDSTIESIREKKHQRTHDVD